MSQNPRRRAPLQAERVTTDQPEETPADEVVTGSVLTVERPTGSWQAGDGKWYPAPAPPGHWQASDGNWYPPTPAVAAPQAATQVAPQTVAFVSVSNGSATAALVLGILGALIGLIPLFFFGAWFFGVLAVVLGLVGRSRAKKLPMPLNRGRATAGIVLGLVAIGLGVVGVAIIDSAVDELDQSIAMAGEGTADDPAADDVAVTGCAADSFGGITVTGTITNHSSEMSNYLFSINVVDGAGTKIGEAGGIENNIASGQNANWETMAFVPDSALAAPFSCDLVDVTRLSAE